MRERDADQAATPEYTWPQCTSCHHNLRPHELGRHTCFLCQDRAAQHLSGIATMYPHLNTPTALTPTCNRSRSTPTPHRGAPGGRTTAPAPIRVDTLSLITAGGIATRLAAIEDAWRLALGRRIPIRHDTVRVFATWRTNPTADVPEHVNFLRINLERACESYPEIAQDLDDIRRLHNECAAALDPAARPARISIGACPTPTGDTRTPCGAPLTATTGSHRVHCTTCGSTWDGLAAWTTLRRAQEATHPAAAAA